MLVLALDTCLNACQAALVRDGEPMAVAIEPMARGHQERLGPMLQAMITESGAAFAEVDRIACTVGPGSFTGLRVGVAFAKGLALALSKPAVPVGSLESLGRSAPEGLALALVDARRSQAYWQAFRDGVPLTRPQAWGLTEIVDWTVEHGAPQTLIGAGAGLLAARFPRAQVHDLPAPDILAIAAIGAERNPAPLTPLYLRTPDAKLPGGIDPFA